MQEAKHTPGYRLRWKKDDPERGLARITAGPRASTLRDANGTVFARVQAHQRSRLAWFWVAGWEGGIPHRNTCGEPPLSEMGAKSAALSYVKAAIAEATQ